MTDPVEQQHLVEAAVEDGGHFKFVGLAFSEIWREALILIPVIAWNNVMLKVLDKLWPAEFGNKSKNLWAGIIYATAVTLLVIVIFYFYLRAREKSKAKKEQEANQS